MNSAIFRGEVVHTRFRPRAHRLKYRVFSLLLDLDEMPVLSRSHRLFGHNRSAVFSFRDEDHGSMDPRIPLKDWVIGRLHAAGLAMPDMRFSVLCYPRIFGYVFNPLTVYFCYRSDDTLTAVLYEVCNTYGERHTYIIPVAAGETADVRQSCEKKLYVSPFMPMDCTYHFHIEPPEKRVAIRINESDVEGRLLYAAFEGARVPFSDRALAAVLLAYPLMTLKVTVAIHWEALRLWLKGMKVFSHKPAIGQVSSSVVEEITADGGRHG